jgi:hypothetical protein
MLRVLRIEFTIEGICEYKVNAHKKEMSRNRQRFCGLLATIPQYANGTKMLIPFPGVMSPEDVVIIGADVRLRRHGKHNFPWLYGFEYCLRRHRK